MARRSFSSMEYYSARCSDVTPLMAFGATNIAEAKDWRIRAHAKARDLLGELPLSVHLEPETLETVDLGTYVREKVVFDADAHSSVPAYVLIPKDLNEPAPALICLHGHGPGKDVVAGVTDADERDTEETKILCIRQQNCDYARQFAMRGYVTIAIDLRCFGERSDDGRLRGRDPCNVQFMRGCLLGIYPLALNLHDIIRTVDYLRTRPEVNPELIGCVGLGVGGMMTLWAAAMEKRIKAGVISGYLSELDDFAVHRANVCGTQVLPNVYRYFDLCDIAALAAPRPMMIQSGLHDEMFPVESARNAVARLKKAYAAWDKPGMLQHDVFAGGNEFHSETAYAWFDKWLGNPK